MSKHTPGPWNMAGPNTISNAAKTIGIAHISTYSVEQSEAEANVRLIAAAPDLLEALRTIVIHAASVQMDPQWAVKVARSAIAKATGESK